MIIDVQKGMFAEDDPVANGSEFLETLRDLIVQAREANIPVVYVQHIGSENSPLALDSPGFPIHPAIAPGVGELVIRKHHSDSFCDTILQQELKKRGVEKIIMAGIQTEFCVDTTCRRAYSLGYEVILVQDGHSTWDSQHLRADQIIAHHNETLGNSFASLAKADEIKYP